MADRLVRVEQGRTIFGRLRRRPEGEGRLFATPPNTCLFAVGDLHGRLDLLDKMHRQIVSEAARRGAARNVVIYIGDYIDRGPDSRGVIDRVIAGLPSFEAVRLLGNHERELLAVLDGEREGDHWLSFGGLATLKSYGVGPRDLSAAPGALRRLLLDVLPPQHLAFLKGLTLLHREGDICFVHAGIRPGVALDVQDPEDLIWIREPFLNSGQDHGVLVVHGHTITPRPEQRPNRVGIDTGAYSSGRLTCLVAEGTALSFMNT